MDSLTFQLNHYLSGCMSCLKRKRLSVISAKSLFLLVSRDGFEPSTYWLKVSCSTNWANGPLSGLLKNTARCGQPRKQRKTRNLWIHCSERDISSLMNKSLTPNWPFLKMHGLGNDFVILDWRKTATAANLIGSPDAGQSPRLAKRYFNLSRDIFVSFAPPKR